METEQKLHNSNQIYSETMKRQSSAGVISREEILKSYSKEHISKCWDVFSKYILKNYQAGKGTVIPKFGVFTYNAVEVNLEGTTNQHSRDLKARLPVFIVSSEFVERLRPGMHTQHGLVYYTQKQMNNVGQVRMNFAEMAISMGGTKDDFSMVLTQMLKFIGDSILKNQFKNKEMPGLGSLVLKNNILGVKFYDEVIESVRLAPQNLIHAKTLVNLFMEVNEKANNGLNRSSNLTNLSNATTSLSKTLNNLRPKTAVLTKITRGGEKWLKENYDIDLNELNEINEEKTNKINNSEGKYYNFNNNNSNSITNEKISLINDIKKYIDNKPKSIEELNIKPLALEAIYFQKGLILSELKTTDKKNSGVIKNAEFIAAVMKANVDMLTSQNISDIINLYSDNQEHVNYTNIIGQLLRDIQNIKNNSISNISIGNNNPAESKVMSMKRSTSAFTNKNLTGINNINNKNQLLNSSVLSVNSNQPISSIYTRKIEIQEVSKEIKIIKIIIDKLTAKYSTMLDQKISIGEFSKILREYAIIFPRDKFEKILTFIDISNQNAFSFKEFFDKLSKCKILSSELSSEEIILTFNKLKDIVYSLGGKTFLFSNNSNNNNSISKEEFINLLKTKSTFSEDILETIFNYLTKTGKDLTLEEYTKHFEEVKNNQLDEDFEIKAISIINNKINKKSFKHEEYFNHMLSYVTNKTANTLNLIEFHKVLASENFSFTAEEINFIFKLLDTKKDGVLDREEFLKGVKKVYKTLYKIKDIIKKNNLEIEDVIFRLNIDTSNISNVSNENFNFTSFKSKMKVLDPTFDHEFIFSLFNEMKTGSGDSAYVDTKTIVKEFDVFKKDHFRNNNNESFKTNFMEHIKAKTGFIELKSSFHKIDTFSNGLLTKVDFCSIIQKVTKEYKDEDIMKFIRITNLFSDDKVKYAQFLDLIFYNSKDNKFTSLIDTLVKYYTKECNKDLYSLFSKILNKEYKKPIGKVKDVVSNTDNSIKIDQMCEFVKNTLKLTEAEVSKNLICKLDLDCDGKISMNDLKGVLDRYLNTSYFKFDNSDKSSGVNIFPSERINDEKFKAVVRDIKTAMKSKNITEVGLFNKLDGNKDGFISHPEFCNFIDDILKLAPGIKDQFFNYLDVRNLGMVDLETFLKRFKEYNSSEIIMSNDWTQEGIILKEFSKWVRQNLKLTGDELFAVIDFDCDGIINTNDLQQFIVDKLKISRNEFTEFKLERVMQRISLTKNKNIGIGDLKDFMIKSRNGENFEEKMNEIAKLTNTNSNLKEILKNADWIPEAIERLGLYISENYESTEGFFEENKVKNSDRMRIEDFKIFVKKNHKCFDGFNLTSDEILTIYSALDPHKKNYITFEDLKNKLSNFDFYRKMHLDILNFIKENFLDGVEVFRYFKKSEKSEKIDKSEKSENEYLITKEFFDGINNIFPNKYQTNTIIKYLQKKFKLEDSKIPFYEFNYVYFDEIKNNKTVSNKSNFNLMRIKSGKLNKRITSVKGTTTNNDDVIGNINSSMSMSSNNGFKNGLGSRAQSANPFSFASTHSQAKLSIATPFDEDPLEKIKRIIHSSRFDFTSFFQMYELVSDNGLMNQFEFKNMIKKLNLGLTSIEIDQIMNKAGKGRDGKVNIRKFSKFMSAEDPNLAQLKKNIATLISQIKQNIYKYYTSPKLAFQFNDKSISNQMDFNKFKQIISDLFERETKPAPNFALLKNAFDYIDLRKDGIIDLNEWLKAFSTSDNVANPILLKNLKEWENSRDVSSLYAMIAKNKKIIAEKAKRMLFKQVLKDLLISVNISNTQWKIIVGIADRQKNNILDFNLFISLIEQSTKLAVSHTKIR